MNPKVKAALLQTAAAEVMSELYLYRSRTGEYTFNDSTFLAQMASMSSAGGGAAAVDLAFVACGRIDGYWEKGLSNWDIAAGIPIVELAGGVVGDYKDKKFDLKKGRIIASNKYIHKELISELKKVNPLDARFFGG